jgi:hypothetical protein
MAVGNEKGGKKYKPFIKKLSELKQFKEFSDIWSLPSESEIGVHYHIYFDNKIPSPIKPKISKLLPDITSKLEKIGLIKENNDIKRNSVDEMVNYYNNTNNKSYTVDFKANISSGYNNDSVNSTMNDNNSLYQQSSCSSLSDDKGIKTLVNFYENKIITPQQTNSRKNSKTYEDVIKLRTISGNSFEDFIPLNKREPQTKKINPNFSRVDDIIKKEIDQNLSRISVLNTTKLDINKLSNYVKTVLESEKYIINDNDDIPSFCKAFFIAGLPFKNAKIIPNSEERQAPCAHQDCSILSAYKPEILYRYPTKDTNFLELNSLVI